MTCKDCIHYCWCKDTIADENWNEDAPKEIKEMFSPVGCDHFKNQADFVEVVRCKDCKYYEIHKPSVTLNCERNGRVIPMMPNDFCSYGERKDT